MRSAQQATSHNQETGANLPDLGASFVHCWEFYAENGEPREQCIQCLVYQARALRCFEMSRLPKGAGFAGAFCKTSCEDCPYYQEQYRHPVRVLVVTDSIRLRKQLASEAESTRFEIRFANNGYECSAVVESFKPDYVLIDCSFPEHARLDLCTHLVNDHRIPDIQIVVAQDSGQRGALEEIPGVIGEIAAPISLCKLDSLVSGRQMPEKEAKASA